MREYEIVYIFDSALNQEAVDGKLETFHTALGGKITAVDHWGVRQLAYPIRKSSTGYYVIVQATANPVGLPEFERLVRLDEETMRYLVVLNEGQPTSGASLLAHRPANPAAENRDDRQAGPETAGEADTGNAPDAGEDETAGRSDAGRPSGPPVFSGARGRRRRHEGPPVVLLNYKDVTTLSRFLTEQGKILPKRTTKVTARFQRRLGTAVKRARHLALLPYVKDHQA